MSQKRVQKLITFSEQLYQLMHGKAKRLGLSFPEYVRMLGASDVKGQVEAAEMVDEETEKSIGQSLKEYAEGKYTTIRTDKELQDFLKID